MGGDDIAREELARVALRQCGEWCRRRSGDPRWRMRADLDWDQVVVVAALRVAEHFRPVRPGGMPHRNFVAGCCRIALSDLTRTHRRRAAAGFEPALRFEPETLDRIVDPRACEPWVEAAINEEWRP